MPTAKRTRRNPEKSALRRGLVMSDVGVFADSDLGIILVRPLRKVTVWEVANYNKRTGEIQKLPPSIAEWTDESLLRAYTPVPARRTARR